MRLTSWNFLHGQALDPATVDGVTPLEASLNEIATDVLALQEVDHLLPRSGSTNQCAEIASKIGAQWWGFAPSILGTPGEKWRRLIATEQKVITSENVGQSQSSYGIALISNQPVSHWLRFELGKSLIGMPLAIAGENGKLRLLYVRDEPRVALAAVLENGWTVINTHLSFVPLFNIYQLLKLSRWAKKVEREFSTRVLLVGDFNLPWGIPTTVTRWKRATTALTYPSWDPKISFDYILADSLDISSLKEVAIPVLPVSDHRPISVAIN
ncbi:MAG: endonuclease/exonuclease/phosphatase family protein [Candidatus Planktophila sp.]